MITWRRQLPVHSPLDTGALLAGVRGLVSWNGTHARAERELAALLQDRYGARAVLLTASGTAALTAALVDIANDRGVGPVALPAYACYDVATAADGAGVPVLLYDVDPETLGPDLAQIARLLRHGARTIVVAHLYGCPVDLTEINALASAAGALVIEDAAQAAGATVKDRPAGSQGSLAILSFGRGKGLTGGSGGAILAMDEAGEGIVGRIRRHRRLAAGGRGWPDFAALSAQWMFQHPRLYAIPAALPMLHLGETRYRQPRPLRGPTTVACRVTAASWAAAEREVDVRRRNAQRLLAALAPEPAFQTIALSEQTRAGFLRLPAVMSAAARAAASQRAAQSLGIMPGYPQPLSELQPLRRRCLNRDDHFPGSRLLAKRLCTFPTHGRLTVGDLGGLERWIREWGRRGAA